MIVNTDDLLSWLKGFAIAALFAGFIGFVVYAAYENEKEWQAYSLAHHCRKIRHTDAITMIGIDGKGRMTTNTFPATNTYLCDGGEEITR